MSWGTQPPTPSPPRAFYHHLRQLGPHHDGRLARGDSKRALAVRVSCAGVHIILSS